MGAELFVARKVIALGEKIQVEFAKHRRKAINVVELAGHYTVRNPQPVTKRLLPAGDARDKKSVGVDPHTFGDNIAGAAVDDRHLLRLRQHRAHANAAGSFVHTEKCESVAVARLDDCLDFRIGKCGCGLRRNVRGLAIRRLQCLRFDDCAA